ncbi:MAG: hypothetical protein ABJA90_02550 [Ginsengibacter sp.]
MSIDNIPLPVSMYQSLFKKNLVDLKAKPGQNNSLGKEKSIDFLGGNGKNIAFILSDPHHKFLNDNELKFLSGLISACDITMADIAIVNFAHYKDLDYKNVISALASKKILCFGVLATDLNLPFAIPDFQVQLFNEVQYIFCPNFEHLQKNISSKKQLWASLQKIFKINK